MILESVADIGVSESWLRKLLPETLKLTKHTRKDYLKLQHQRDQQPLQQQQPQQQQKELVELPTSLSSRHPAVEQQQPQDEETFTALGYLKLFDNDAPIKVTVNVKTRSIEAMEIAHEIIHNAKMHNAKTYQ